MASTGRPEGTFGDPASRMRAWTVLGALQRASRASALTDIATEWGVPHATLKRVLDDGADPDRVEVGERVCLLSHLGRRNAQGEQLIPLYRHPLWRYLAHWSTGKTFRWPLPFASGEHWLAHQMQAHGVLALEVEDQEHAIALGVLEQPTPWEESPFLQVERFVSLDGLLTLLLLWRDAVEQLEQSTAQPLRSALWAVASQWEQVCGYDGEALDTWRWLLNTRINAWWPHFRPHAQAMAQAQRQMLGELASRRDTGGAEGPRGQRATRRLRRQILMRAGRLQFEQNIRGGRRYVLYDPDLAWVRQHRAQIGAQLRWAQATLTQDMPPAAPTPPPLSMPLSLFQRRQRPTPRLEDCEHYGTRLPFDIIPVQPQTGA